MSEIDDIFSSTKQKKKHSSTFLPESKSVESSSKKRPLPETVVVNDTSPDLPGPSKRRKKDSIPKSSSKKLPLPETVVDTSANISGPSKPRKKDSIPNKSSKPTKSKKSEHSDFADSRGSGDRKSHHLHSDPSLLYVSIGRKTEEGWSVYKEAELGLNNNGGGKWLTLQILFFMAIFNSDTPSCPFDCNCCKPLFSSVITLLLIIV